MENSPRRPLLELLLASSRPVRAELDGRCRALVEQQREHFPEALRHNPLPPGEITDAIVLEEGQLSELLIVALTDESDREALLLSDGINELLVRHNQSRVFAREGLLLVSLTVECDQTGAVEVTIPFAVGSAQALAGMVTVTEEMPRGPTAVVSIWGDALQALAWESLLILAAGMTRQTGTDTNAVPFIPAALVASTGAVRIVPQARHDIDTNRRQPRR
jgi:hypothetical protein